MKLIWILTYTVFTDKILRCDQNRECYYPSVRMENKGLQGQSACKPLFSVRQGRWVDLLLDQLGFTATCTLVTLKLLTGIHAKS